MKHFWVPSSLYKTFPTVDYSPDPNSSLSR
jgi:hypothetical protein